jgi:flagellar motility protein MotE (MotC chaperone)
LLREEHEAEERLAQLANRLKSLEECESLEMERWLGQYGITQLVHQGRVDGLTAQIDTIKVDFFLKLFSLSYHIKCK